MPLNLLKLVTLRKRENFLWGSMAQALKVVAASRERELNTHEEIRRYARELAKRGRDESIWNGFSQASYLHSNFYEAGLSMEEVLTYSGRIRTTVRKLLEMIPTKE
jgi:hypothetical protein